ncbi:hypothetical protein [Caldithrix abyssi]
MRNAGGSWGRYWLEFDGDYVIYELGYVSLLPYYRLKSNVGHLFKEFYVILGTPISFLTDARQSWTIETDGEYYHLDLGPDNLYPELNKFEVGLKYGLSLHFVGRIYTDFIFYKSFTKLYKS